MSYDTREMDPAKMALDYAREVGASPTVVPAQAFRVLCMADASPHTDS